jgi:hypothetical protein
MMQLAQLAALVAGRLNECVKLRKINKKSGFLPSNLYGYKPKG